MKTGENNEKNVNKIFSNYREYQYKISEENYKEENWRHHKGPQRLSHQYGIT